MFQNKFEEVGKAGNNTIRSLVNLNSINQLKNFVFPRRIEMKNGDQPVLINDATSYVHTPLDCDYNSPELGQWSLIALYHQNIGCKITEVLDGFYEAVGDAFFLPIGYHRDKFIDYFLIRNQNDALRELLKNKLQIQVRGWKLPMIVKLEVSTCVEGQIRPKRVFGVYIQRKIRESSTFGVLDLSKLCKEMEFVDMRISLKNRGVSKMFFDELNSIKIIKNGSKFRTIKLCNNEISSLEQFSKFNGFNNIEKLDLSYNNILNINELHNLRTFVSLKELNIEMNPCCNYPNIEGAVSKILPNLQKLNSKDLFSAQLNMQVTAAENGNREISNVGEGILIKSSNAREFRNRFIKLENPNCWTQIILHHNKRYTAIDIINELSSNLLKNVYFFPCYHKRIENRDEFFLYRNFDALKLLFTSGLKISMPQNSFTIDVQIRLNVAEYKMSEVYWVNKIREAITKRIKDDVLDLNDFPKDPEFAKMTVPMNSDKTLEFILATTKNFSPNVKRINAENCGILSCSALEESLYTLPKLTTLNLRHNNIKTLADFKKCTSITDLYLDGNPVCNLPAIEYIKHVREHFKNVIWIDGHRIFEKNTIVSYQNYLVKNSLYTVVSEFVSYYFQMWDSFDRAKLTRLLYSKSSIFTMSIYYEYHPEMVGNMNLVQLRARIENLIKYNRNFVKMSDLGATNVNVFVGRDIDKVFNDMNRSKHDFSIMTIDVPFFDAREGKFSVTVSGAFEDFLNISNGTGLIYSFSRTFIVKVVDGRYVILNDQLLLREPTALQVECYNKRTKIVTKQEIQEQCRNLLPREFEQQHLKIEILQNLTECSKQQCKKLLQDCSWDLKVALGSFCDTLERNESGLN